MAQALPRGIHIVIRTAADNTKTIRYRVRRNRKTLKIDEYFDTLDEAKACLDNATGKTTEEIEEEKNYEAAMLMLELTAPTFRTIATKYEEEIIGTMPTDSELQRRNASNLKSFVRTINKTIIDVVSDIYDHGVHGADEVKIKVAFGDLDLRKISRYQINSYITARLALKKKKSSIGREISIISQIYENAMSSEAYQNIQFNPVQGRNKKLLANPVSKKKKRLNKADSIKIFEALDNYRNSDMKFICQLAVSTAMRRSEIINLTWEQVDDDAIELTVTKNKKERRVFLTDEAKEILANIRKSKGTACQGRVFTTYSSIAGFEGSFSKFMDSLELGHITFHVFRKEAFSRFFDNLKGGSATMLTEFLGVRSVRKFIELHAPKEFTIDTEKGILEMAGHSNQQVGKDHYLTPSIVK
ncbi:MAG: site-specific integrase [Polaromonas sp.]|nr:site-specific integrase [Polaromonas sp.]